MSGGIAPCDVTGAGRSRNREGCSFTEATASRRQLLNAMLAISVATTLPQWCLASPNVEQRLLDLGITLPSVAPSVASYVPYVVSGDLVYIAGQLPLREGQMVHPGAVPRDVSLEQAVEAARQCGVNVLAALKAACAGDLGRVRQCVRLDGFVATAGDFTQQSAVIDGASGLMMDAFGNSGRHTRTAVGVNALPGNACVEVAAVFSIGR